MHDEIIDDERLIGLWLHGKSDNTQDAYLRDILAFTEFVDVPLPSVTLDDIQAYDRSLERFKSSTRARKLSAVKSLLSFGHRIGYLYSNVGAPVRTPTAKDTLSERILEEDDVIRILSTEPDQRNKLILIILYLSGMRVSELCRLQWRDLKIQRASAQLNVFGKGGRTRTIMLPKHVGDELSNFSESNGPDEPIFASKKTGGALHRSQVYRIVRQAARRAGISESVSPHWLRHAHASHALDNGAPTHLVQATLGHQSLATTGRYAHVRPRDSSARYIRQKP